MKHYINRELSWIEFNKRVLEEAFNPTNPIFERIKFLSISGSNLDEFLMVRFAGVVGQVNAGINDLSLDGQTPEQVLNNILNEVKKIIISQQQCWENLRCVIEKININIVKPSDLSNKELTWLENVFDNQIYPTLTPLAIDPAHPFPFINNLGYCLILQLKDSKKINNVLIPIPEKLKRFQRILNTKNFMLIKDILTYFLYKIFPNTTLVSFGTFRVIRDSDIEFSDESEDLVLSFENQLKQRRMGKAVFLEVLKSTPNLLKKLVIKELNVEENNVQNIDEIHEISSLTQITEFKINKLQWKNFEPRYPERLKESNNNCFLAIKKKEFIVHHPYESFDVVIQFLRQAASDPNVLVIKQTLYRTVKENSEIALALIEAAEKGKFVTAIVELKARFDEEVNIKYSKDLEKAGVQVVFTSSKIKTHAKLSLVVRKEKFGLKVYTHIGTGNYHPDNAKIYADLSLFSSDNMISNDVQKVFNMITGYAKNKTFEKLFVAPVNLKSSFIGLIKNEIKNKKNGLPSGIWLKCNSLVDKDLIDNLYFASKAGVKIELIIRGICCLKPGIKGLSENIRVRSIVGRFLEHSRIYCFSNGFKMPSKRNKVYISSADLMPRNFERRFEVMVPINTNTVHKQVLSQIMLAYLNDTKQSWLMNNDGTYRRTKANKGDKSAHEYFMSNPSLSGRGKALKKNKPQKIYLKK